MSLPRFTIILALLLLPALAVAADAQIIKTTVACDSIGTFMMADNFRVEGDEVAAKKIFTHGMQRGVCLKVKKGTRVIFTHFMTVTDGDYGNYTTVRRVGDTRSLVVEKCALDNRDPAVARYSGATMAEDPCPE